MKRFLLALLLIGFIAADANAFFGRGRGGCSTAGCNTDTSPSAVNDSFTFVPSKTKTAPAPAGVGKPVAGTQGPVGPQGMPGKDGQPGQAGANGKDAEVTQAQLDFIANHVLEQMRQDPNFRGTQGLAGKDGRDGKDGSSPDVPTLVAAIVPELPPIRVEFQGPNNSIASTQVVKIGGTIRVPPVVTATRSANGELAKVEHSLGDTTTLFYTQAK